MYRTNEELDRKLDNENSLPTKSAVAAAQNIETTKNVVPTNIASVKNSTNRPTENFAALAAAANGDRAIERVIVLYTDKTFEAFYLN